MTFLRKWPFIVLTAFLLFPVIGLNGQIPEWVTNHGTSTQYPNSQYLTGFGVAWNQAYSGPEEAVEAARRFASGQLTEKVLSRVKTQSESILQENNEALSESFKYSVSTGSEMELVGLDYAVFRDPSESIVYALAFVNRSQQTEFIRAQARQLFTQLEDQIRLAQLSEKKGGAAQPIPAYYKCMPIMAIFDNQITLLQVLTGGDLEKTDEELIQKKRRINTLVQHEIAKADLEDIHAISDMVRQLVLGLDLQVPLKGKEIQVRNFLYQNTPLSSRFSDYMNQMICQNLSQHFKCMVRSDELSQTVSPAALVLDGTYWVEGDKIRVISWLKNGSSVIQGSIEKKAPLAILDSQNLPWKPDNFSNAINDLKLFEKNDQGSNGLVLSAWTNKGDRNLIFREGDEMEIGLRANLPVYIRIIYHLADGSRCLLLDNYFLDGSRVNQAFKIPETFVCMPPFGSETMQIFAQTKPFLGIETTRQGDYEMITDDLSSILNKTRGFVKKSDQQNYYTEKRLVFTTIR